MFFVTCILLLLGFFLQNIYEGLWKMRGWMDWGRLEREGIDINEDKHTKYFLVHFRVLCFASFVFYRVLACLCFKRLYVAVIGYGFSMEFLHERIWKIVLHA